MQTFQLQEQQWKTVNKFKKQKQLEIFYFNENWQPSVEQYLDVIHLPESVSKIKNPKKIPNVCFKRAWIKPKMHFPFGSLSINKI